MLARLCGGADLVSYSGFVVTSLPVYTATCAQCSEYITVRAMSSPRRGSDVAVQTATGDYNAK